MLFRAPLPRRFVDLGSRIGQAARERLEAGGVDDIQHTADAVRRRLERARFSSDVSYAEHLIARALRQGQAEQHEHRAAE